jgi:amidohydrolase
MPVVNRIAEFTDEMARWRREIHAHPELAFEERSTAELVARLLESFGIAVERGIARTGVVGTLEGSRPGPRRVALRADLDALPITEESGAPYASRRQGRMHACGHDGHTAMLLGAAKYLAETRNFCGTIHFIFQPAEENEGGARVMIEEGLLARYPVDAVYGMHNWPELPVGQFAIRPGAMMAAFDIFELTIKGRGAHGAMPHLGIDPIVAAAQVVTALQTITSRNLDPLESAVLSVTQIHGGETWNVIPESVVLRGTTRSFNPALRDRLEPLMRRIAEGVCGAAGAEVTLSYEKRYPPTRNSAAETEIAAGAAAEIVGKGNVRRDFFPSMAAEDFAYFLEEKPGAYIWIGNGGAAAGRVLHNPTYDFNDEVLSLGASYWVRLAEVALAREGTSGGNPRLSGSPARI